MLKKKVKLKIIKGKDIGKVERQVNDFLKENSVWEIQTMYARDMIIIYIIY